MLLRGTLSIACGRHHQCFSSDVGFAGAAFRNSFQSAGAFWSSSCSSEAEFDFELGEGESG